MKYHDSIAKSTEYLGPVLSLMAKQTAAMDTVSCAVWYECVAGINPSLKTAIDEHLSKGESIYEDATYDIFNRHVADIDAVVVQRLSKGFQKVIAEMSSSAAQAGDQAGQFGDALEKWRTEQASSNQGNSDDVDLILGLTRTMQGSIVSLKGRLDESRHEIETLRQEVGKAREDALADGLTGD